MLYGDQADGSSIIFYTHRPALLVHGATQYFSPDPETKRPGVRLLHDLGFRLSRRSAHFLSDADLLRLWGTGPRKLLFVPGDFHDHVQALLGSRLCQIQELSDKTLYTDRPAVNQEPARLSALGEIRMLRLIATGCRLRANRLPLRQLLHRRPLWEPISWN